MKKLIVVMFSLLSVSAFADVNNFEARRACESLKEKIPTATGTGISVNECLRVFAFDEVYSNEMMKIVLLVGETVADKTTVCEVTMYNDTQDVIMSSPACRVE
jgi:hypothetical protein